MRGVTLRGFWCQSVDFLAALILIAFRLTNDQARYIRDPSADLINTLLEEAM